MKQREKLRWFNFKAGFAFHAFNAWEHVNEKGETEISIIVCGTDFIDLDLPLSSNQRYPKPHHYRINLTTQETFEKCVSDVECEFPIIHPNLVGRPIKFAFCATLSKNRQLLFDGLVKFDLSSLQKGSIKEVASIKYGGDRFGGEAVFVPRKNSQAEDDGFLMAFVFDEKTEKSEFVVFDAKTMSPEPIVRVALPQRVPYGFHGLFIDEEKLNHQKDYLP